MKDEGYEWGWGWVYTLNGMKAQYEDRYPNSKRGKQDIKDGKMVVFSVRYGL